MRLEKQVASVEKEKGMHGLVGKPEERTSLRRLTVDGRVKKLVSNRVRWRFSWLRQGKVVTFANITCFHETVGKFTSGSPKIRFSKRIPPWIGRH